MASRPGAPPGGPPAEQKKGEVNELRVLLRTVNTDKDSKRKRDVIKKVRRPRAWAAVRRGALAGAPLWGRALFRAPPPAAHATTAHPTPPPRSARQRAPPPPRRSSRT